DLNNPDGPECMSALVGAALAENPLPAKCPAEELSEQDKQALTTMTDFVTGRGINSITLATDTSKRSIAAEQTVKAEAARRGIAVTTTENPEGPVFVVSGWEPAAATLNRIAHNELPTEGAYLAPWLLTAPLLNIPAGQLLPL